MLLVAMLMAGCGADNADSGLGGGDSGGGAWRPDLVCPGDAGCESVEGQLLAGAAAEVITPTCFESWEDSNADGTYTPSSESFFDCGCDRLCEGDEGWPGADEGEGDGDFQGVWIAGFGQSRPASAVHDDMWARTVVLQQGDLTLAVVSLDVVGWFYDDGLAIHQAVLDRGLDVDQVVVHATHQHEGPDTVGQWGPSLTVAGTDRDYMDQVIAKAADSIETAVSGLQPAALRAGAIDTAAPFGSKGTRNTVRDSRDPVIIDEQLSVAQLTAVDGGETIATLVNWSNHPEVVGSENTLITSDFPHYLRQGVEQGVGEQPGTGGVCVFINGTVGGLMTPLGITVTDFDGVDWSGDTFEKAEALGGLLASLALQALDEGSDAADPGLELRSAELFVPVENYAFQALFLIGIFDRSLFNYDPEENLTDENTPEVKTRMDFLRVGPVAMLTVPGELTPELAIGGYDGSRVNTDEDDFVDPGNENPPDLSQAPEGPYFKELMGGDYNWIIGLGNDELGYLVPTYDYKLSETSPYLEDAPGDHYEETNSIGPSATPLVTDMAEALLTWTP